MSRRRRELQRQRQREEARQVPSLLPTPTPPPRPALTITSAAPAALPHKCPVRDIAAAAPHTPQTPIQPSNVPQPLLYTVAELADVLRVSRATIDRLHACGVLPGKVKIGHQVRYLRQVVQTWLTQISEFHKDGNQTEHGGSNQPSGPVHGPNL